MSFKGELAYRVHFFISAWGAVTEIAVLWFLWTAIFNASASQEIQGFTFSTMITYASISTIMSVVFGTWTEFMIEEDVRTGRISNILTKPVDYIAYRFFGEFGRSLFKISVVGLPIILITFFILNLSLPSNPMFFISVALGFLINFLLSLLVGMWAFFTAGNVWGLSVTRDFVSDVISGSIIPVYLFPEWLKGVAYVLPFQAVFNIPLSIYIGKITSYEIISSIGVQLFWLFGLGLLCLAVWRTAERNILINGG